MTVPGMAALKRNRKEDPRQSCREKKGGTSTTKGSKLEESFPFPRRNARTKTNIEEGRKKVCEAGIMRRNGVNFKNGGRVAIEIETKNKQGCKKMSLKAQHQKKASFL